MKPRKNNKLELQWSSRTRGLDRKTAWAFACALGALFVFVGLKPALALNIILWTAQCLILGMAGLRLLAIILSGRPKIYAQPSDSTFATDSGFEWPRFTVLVPLYQEAHMVSTLIDALSSLNYPKDKLDIIMVCEEDDPETCAAVQACLAPPFHLFKVPASMPRTKPKALNAAMASRPKATPGELVTIYDAEDRPHPEQLKQAALAFAANDKFAALQAPLGYFNDKTNILTGLFSLEYAALFHVWNPALARLGLPFTLGGTSNHIRRDILERAGGWDSHNVTEDADLGFRLSALNHQSQDGQRNRSARLKIGTIGHGTQEEAVANLPSWTAQRTRWIKGFMQTWMVHMRLKRRGPDGGHLPLRRQIFIAACLQITVGATLLAAFLHVPSVLFIGGALALDLCQIVDFSWPISFVYVLSLGYLSAIFMGMAGAVRAKKLYLIPLVLLMPFYWLLQFPPALMAAYEFIIAPAYWRKTVHKGTTPDNKITQVEAAQSDGLDPATKHPI